ncbi:MAG: glycosyl [Planctomycetota bacterium]|nr:MAG: glycosyl [Planctomycetota bacterium]
MIINWNGTRDTIELLESLARENDADYRLHAIVVDNGSIEAERLALADGIRGMDNRLHVDAIWNSVNRGVPAAYNQAIQADGPVPDAFLRLDNDVVVLPGGIRLLWSRLQAWRSTGIRIAGGNTRCYDAPNENNGGAIDIRLLSGRVRGWFPPEDMRSDGVLGCVMLLDRELVEALLPQVFDEWLFLFGDESELSLRARDRGWGTLYIAKPIALHKGGASTEKVPLLSRTYSIRNGTYLALTYVRPRAWRPVVLARLVLECVWKLLKLDFAACRSLAAGIAAGLGKRPARSERRD